MNHARNNPLVVGTGVQTTDRFLGKGSVVPSTKSSDRRCEEKPVADGFRTGQSELACIPDRRGMCCE
jgi:hypothetical protein